MKSKKATYNLSGKLLLLAFIIAGSLASESIAQDSDYKKEIETWRAENEQKLRAPNGWLALTGHYWLKEGANSIGTDQSSTVVLPGDVGNKVKGSVSVLGSIVQLDCLEDSRILVDGKWQSKARLTIDLLEPETNGKEVITIDDRITLQLVRRVSKLAIRVRDKENSRLKDFTGKKWFDVDPKYRVEARFIPATANASIKTENIRGDNVDSKLAGEIEFAFEEKNYRLQAIDEGDSLFIVFKDETSGKSTYGTGRFLDIPRPAEGEKIDLDFNKAYNPPCAFNPHTLCPIPTKQNQLDIQILAGERY